MNNNDNELKPCPFCGYNADIEFIGHPLKYYIECCYCECVLGLVIYDCDINNYAIFNTKQEAIDAWNIRKGE